VSPTPSLAALSTAEEHHTSPAHHSTLRPWLAATLSLICGLGQLYNGQLVKGVVLLICGIATVAAWPFLLGKMLALILWLYAVSDAYLVARRTLPMGHQRQHAKP
jgi:TM2 domain-containing membrane protein YozV